MNEQGYNPTHEQLRRRTLRHTLNCYALGLYGKGCYARATLALFISDLITDPTERHFLAYLRWYAAGNQDGGACARIALEIAG